MKPIVLNKQLWPMKPTVWLAMNEIIFRSPRPDPIQNLDIQIQIKLGINYLESKIDRIKKKKFICNFNIYYMFTDSNLNIHGYFNSGNWHLYSELTFIFVKEKLTFL